MSMLGLQSDLRTPRSLWAIVSAFITLVVLFSLSTSHLSSSYTFARHHDGPTSSARDLMGDVTNATLGVRDPTRTAEEGLQETDEVFGAQFERIFVISLPRRTDHRDRLTLAGKVSNITFEYVNGVRSGSVDTESLPAEYKKELPETVISAWRAHLNVLKKIVDEDVSSALILEDDVDWDVRLKSVLYDFAGPANALASTDLETVDWNDLPTVPGPKHSPYGDGWDTIWLGHCGMDLPKKGLVLHHNDSTVPQDRDLKSWEADKTTPLSHYPQHTRAIIRSPVMSTCSLAYAVTQSAARRLLYDVGIDKLDHPYDIMLRDWCARPRSVCLGVLPQIFDHFRRRGPVRTDSDINDNGDEVRRKAFSNNIRFSVQKSLRKMLQGDTTYEDQYPDK